MKLVQRGVKYRLALFSLLLSISLHNTPGFIHRPGLGTYVENLE